MTYWEQVEAACGAAPASVAITDSESEPASAHAAPHDLMDFLFN